MTTIIIIIAGVLLILDLIIIHSRIKNLYYTVEILEAEIESINQKSYYDNSTLDIKK